MKKLVPHFRRSELYFEWGRSPEGEVGEQHSPRDVHPISRLNTTYPLSNVFEFTYNSETNGDGAEMFKRARERSRLNIYACKKLNPVPVSFNTFLVREGGGTILPCQGRNFTRRQGKTGQKGDGNENFTPCGRGVGTFRDFVGICRLIAENGVLASRAGGADGA